MALIVETGGNVAGANSYQTVVEIEVLIASRPESDCFSSLDNDEKENAAIEAIRYLERRFRFYGDPLFTGQSLQYPRTKNYDDKGEIIAQGTIPDQLKMAQAELALEWAKDEESGVTSPVDSAGIVKSFSGDEISVDFEKGDSSIQKTLTMMGTRFVDVELLIKSLAEWKDEVFLDKVKETTRKTS